MGDLAVFVDQVTLLRDWLRGLDIAGLVGVHVWAGGLPTTPTDPATPAITVRRIPGGYIDGPLELVDLQFDVWATTIPVAARVAGALTTQLVTCGRVALGSIDGCDVAFIGVDELTLASGHVPDLSDPNYQRYLVTGRGVFAAKPTP